MKFWWKSVKFAPKNGGMDWVSESLQNFAKNLNFLRNFENWCKGLHNLSDSVAYLRRLWKMLKNASFLAIVAVHTAENEPLKVWKKAEKWALCEAPELTALFFCASSGCQSAKQTWSFSGVSFKRARLKKTISGGSGSRREFLDFAVDTRAFRRKCRDSSSG